MGALNRGTGARLAGFAAAALLLAPAVSEARRTATPAEHAAMAAAEQLRPECVTATVSTIDSRYGTLNLRNVGDCPMGDGYFVLSIEDGAWGELAQVPADFSATCPEGVPDPVGRDLRLCRKPVTYLLCQPRKPYSDWSRDLKIKPRACDTLGPRQSLSEGANMARLRWRGWGKRIARARGIEKGYHLPFARIPNRVKAYRLRTCPGGDRIYTRIKVRTKYGGGVLRFPASCSD